MRENQLQKPRKERNSELSRKTHKRRKQIKDKGISLLVRDKKQNRNDNKEEKNSQRKSATE